MHKYCQSVSREFKIWKMCVSESLGSEYYYSDYYEILYILTLPEVGIEYAAKAHMIKGGRRERNSGNYIQQSLSSFHYSMLQY